MQKSNLNKFLNGYSMMEMLMVLAIIAIMSTMALSASLRYNKVLSSLLNDVNSISMLVRDMQNRTSSFVTADVNSVPAVGYGVFVDLNAQNKIDPFYKTINGAFRPSEAIAPRPDQSLILDSGNYISRICINGCSTYSGASKVAIYFIRPRSYMNFSVPDPNNSSIYINNVPGKTDNINKVCLEISSVTGKYKKRIDMHYVGQVSFASGACE